jgi:hypothetical protein
MPCLEFTKDFLIRFYAIPIGSLIWLLLWVSSLVSTKFEPIPLLKPYVIAQALISLLYLFLGGFLDRGLSIHVCGYSRWKFSSRDLWNRLLEFDIVQRTIFLTLGSGWFYRTIGFWPFSGIRTEPLVWTTLVQVIRGHLILSTLALFLSILMYADIVWQDIRREGLVMYMDTVNPTFWVRTTSIAWCCIWVASIWEHTVFDTYLVYATLQLLLSLFYFVLSYGFTRRFSLNFPLLRLSVEIEPGLIMLILLVVDFIRRIVFICIGSLWFVIASPLDPRERPMTPVEYVFRRGIPAFSDFDFYIQSFVWHMIFSIVMLLIDLLVLFLIVYYIVADTSLESSVDASMVTSEAPKVSLSELFKPFHGSNEELCSICHDDHDSTTLTAQVCGHSFHENCIKPWLDRHLSCPLCRSHLIFVLNPTHHFDGETASVDLPMPPAV